MLILLMIFFFDFTLFIFDVIIFELYFYSNEMFILNSDEIL